MKLRWGAVWLSRSNVRGLSVQLSCIPSDGRLASVKQKGGFQRPCLLPGLPHLYQAAAKELETPGLPQISDLRLPMASILVHFCLLVAAAIQ